MAVDLKRWDVFDWIVPKVKNYSSGESNKIVNRLLEFKGIDRDEMCVHAKKDRRKSGELLDSNATAISTSVSPSKEDAHNKL
jgi:hypothetical protein